MLFQNHDVTAGARKRPARRQPDDAGPDHYNINAFGHLDQLRAPGFEAPVSAFPSQI